MADIWCGSGSAGGHLIQMYGKQVLGHCGLVGGTFSISGSPLGPCQWVGVSLTGQPEGSHFSWTPLFRFPIRTD